VNTHQRKIVTDALIFLKVDFITYLVSSSVKVWEKPRRNGELAKCHSSVNVKDSCQ